MKLPLLLLCFLLLATCWPPMGHGAHHRHGRHMPYALPVPRVLRTPSAAAQPKVVRAVPPRP